MVFMGQKFMSDPVMTKTTVDSPKSIPMITVCPKGWLDTRYFGEQDTNRDFDNGTRQDNQTGESDLEKYLHRTAHRKNGSGDMSNFTDRSQPIDKGIMIQRFTYLQGFMYSAYSMVSMLEKRAASGGSFDKTKVQAWLRQELEVCRCDLTDIFERYLIKNLISVHSNYSFQKFWTRQGLCFKLPVEPVKINPVNADYMNYQISIDDRFAFGDKTTTFCFGCDPEQRLINYQSFDNDYSTAYITVRRTTTVRVKDCVNYSQVGQLKCAAECQTKSCGPTRRSSNFSLRGYNSTNIHLARNMFQENMESEANCTFTETSLEYCNKQCPIACKVETYEATVNRFGGFRNRSKPMTIFVGVKDPNSWTRVEDERFFGTMEFVSAVGGMASLFFGASLWSVVQLVIFVHRVVWGKTKGRFCKNRVDPVKD